MLAPALVIGLMVGAVLGQKYKVFVLGPFFALALLLAGAMAMTHLEAGWRIAEITAVTIFALQLGYAFGIALRHFALLVRAKRLRARAVWASAPSRRAAH